MALKFQQIPGFPLFALGGVALATTVSGIVTDIASHQQTSNGAPAAPHEYNLNLGGKYTTSTPYNRASFPSPDSGSPQSLSFTGPDGTSYTFALASPSSPSLTAPHKDNSFAPSMMTMTSLSTTMRGIILNNSDAFDKTTPHVINDSSPNNINPALDFAIGYESPAPNPATSKALASAAISSPGTGKTAPNDKTVSSDSMSPAPTNPVIPTNTLTSNPPHDPALNLPNSPDGNDPIDETEPRPILIAPAVVPFTPDGPAGSVPEPASLALFGGGLLGLAFVRRRVWHK